jgi:hypothetical protein
MHANSECLSNEINESEKQVERHSEQRFERDEELQLI